jgi:septum formation protein
MMNTDSFILASGSPRRSELLRAAGYQFTVDVADVDETDYPSTASPREVVELLARRKVAAVVDRHPNRVILAADTIVVCDGRIIGKPIDRDDAKTIIRKLAGRTHEVVSGVCVVRVAGFSESDLFVKSVISTVAIIAMPEDALERYVESDRWQGKAGGYGIQDDGSIATIVEGCRTNVIGLPMTTTRELLGRAGIN